MQETPTKRRDLVRLACKHFPTLSLRKRWIRAKERLGPTKPTVMIGCEHAPHSMSEARMPRSTREAGIHYMPEYEVPAFLKRLLKID